MLVMYNLKENSNENIKIKEDRVHVNHNRNLKKKKPNLCGLRASQILYLVIETDMLLE